MPSHLHNNKPLRFQNHNVLLYLAATETTDERIFEAFEDDGVLLMAEEEDSRILRSQIGDKPSQTLPVVVVAPSVVELWKVEQFLRFIEGDEGDGKEEGGVDVWLHSNTSPALATLDEPEGNIFELFPAPSARGSRE